MDAWYQCDECIFASNSPKAAAKHETDSGHHVDQYLEAVTE